MLNRAEIIMVGLAAICLTAAVLGSTGSDGQLIRVSILGPMADEDYDGAVVFKDYVESRTNGEVTVEVFPSAQFCGNPRECIDAMKTGVLDVFMTTVGGLGNVFPPVQVLDLPYVFRDDDVAECVFDGELMHDLRDAVLDADSGLRLMVVSNTGGWRNFSTTTRKVRGPGDLKGLKIRTTAAPIQQELVRQLGAYPTPVPWSELYTAVATGVVDGTKNSVQDLVSMNFHEHIKHIVLDGHAYMSAMWWYSEPRWQKLSPEHQRIVVEGFERLKLVTRALPIRRQIEAYKAFADADGLVYVPSPEEKMAFREASRGMRRWFVEQYGAVWLNKLDAAVKACEQQVDARFKRVRSRVR